MECLRKVGLEMPADDSQQNAAAVQKGETNVDNVVQAFRVCKCFKYVFKYILTDDSIPDTEMTKSEGSRRATLATHLREHGLELQEDSRLCREYIRQAQGDLDEIINTVREINWYFKETSYSHDRYQIQDTLEDIAACIDSAKGKKTVREKWLQNQLAQACSTDPLATLQEENQPGNLVRTLQEKLPRAWTGYLIKSF